MVKVIKNRFLRRAINLSSRLNSCLFNDFHREDDFIFRPPLGGLFFAEDIIIDAPYRGHPANLF